MERLVLLENNKNEEAIVWRFVKFKAGAVSDWEGKSTC
jgi:hypothetical protein